MDDVAMKIISQDKALIKRDLESRLQRIKRLRQNLRKQREASDLEENEIGDFDKSEDYSWWQGLEDKR